MIHLTNFGGVAYRSLKELAILRCKERSWITMEDKGAGVELDNSFKNTHPAPLQSFAFVKKRGWLRFETAPSIGISR